MRDGAPMTFARALRSAEYWLLVIAAIAAVAGLAWWIVLPLTVAGLSISSLPKYLESYGRARAAGVEREWWIAVALSSFNSLGAATGAYLLGVAIRWLWW
jgi:hypothetical protein